MGHSLLIPILKHTCKSYQILLDYQFIQKNYKVSEHERRGLKLHLKF